MLDPNALVAGACPVDGWAVFDATPTPCLLLTPDLEICEANAAYLRATDRTREDLVGLPIFTAFPDNPDDPSAGGVRALRTSLERVLDQRRSDTMPVQRYDIVLHDDAGERWEERWWSPVNAPVLDDGEVALIIHRVEDVTTFVRRIAASDSAETALRDRVTGIEADLLARGQDLARANARLRQAHEREREVARILQTAMLPTAADVPGVESAVRYRPASDAARVGGDWYDIVDLGGDRIAVMATALCAVADLAAARLTVSVAGHPPPVLVGVEADCLEGSRGPALGVLAGVERAEETLALPPGSVLVAFTDGLVERRGEDIDVGLERVRGTAEARAHQPVEQIADALLDVLLEGGAAPDDIALVVLRR